MAHFDRTTHRAFLVALAFKGLDGCLELLGGVALLTITQPQILRWVSLLSREELAEDPGDLLANRAVQAAQHLTPGTQHFVAAYLLAHGVVKMVLVAGMLRRVRWIFPTALVILTAFIVYQMWRLSRVPSWPLGVFTFIDVVVVVLILHEWRHMGGDHPHRSMERDTLR